MNNKALFFAAGALFMVTGATSCTKETVTQVALEFGRKYNAELPLWDTDSTSSTYLVGNLKLIAYTDLTALITTKKQSFVLLVADVNTSCTCFSTFRSTLLSYIKNTNAYIYAIKPSEFNGGVNQYNLNVSSAEGAESVAIFEKGVLKYQRQRNGQEDSWSNDISVFQAWMDARVSISSMLYIDIKQLDAAIKGTLSLNGFDQFTIGFFRGRCGDCSYLAEHFLTTYNQTEHAESYLIDCDVPGIHDPKDGTTDPTDESKATWAKFKKDYGLASEVNTAYGYSTGYVPCFQNRQNGEVVDMEVYDNDILVPNPDGVTCYLGKGNTYWDGSRDHAFFSKLPASAAKDFTQVPALQKITKDDYTSYTYGTETDYYWNHDKAAVYHDPLIKAFLDYYITK